MTENQRLALVMSMPACAGTNEEKIISTMVVKSADAYKLHKADQAVTLASRSSVKISGKPVTVNPHLLFQRLLIVRDRYQDVPSLLRYELCSYPPVLFESSCLPLQPKKSVLADTLWKAMPEEHRVQWRCPISS